MPYYICRVASDDGRLRSQSILATSPQECRKLFEAEGFFVLSVVRDWKKIQVRAVPFGKKIRDADFILFNQELMALIKSGYPILKSIESIAGRVKNIHLKELLLKVEADIRAGKSLSEAFLPHEAEFSKVYTASLMAGERSGNLPGVLARFNHYAKTIAQTKARIRSALAYPTILLLFSFVLVGVLVNFILPRFADFYRDFEADLPAITQALIKFSTAFRSNWLILILLLVLAAAGYLRVRRDPKARLILDRLKLRIPFGREVWKESAIALFSRTLGLLLEAGISLLTALPIALKAIPNAYILDSLKDSPEGIKNGESLSESLSRATVVPPLALDMIRIGEQSANLQGMLAEIADFYDDRIRAKIDTLVSLIEPVVIIFMGLIVAGMLLSVYLPIFNIIRVAR